jgi:hypothetical protein
MTLIGRITLRPTRCVTENVDILCGEFWAGEIFGEESRKGGVHQETKCGIMSHEVMKQDMMQWHSRFSLLFSEGPYLAFRSHF